jgi:protein-S-isoprenylcysteine O-methyltransferase Ste14
MWTAVFVAPWVVFAIWWLARARGNAATARRESRGSRIGSLALFSIAVLLLVSADRITPARLWPPSTVLVTAMLAIEVASVAFAIWAREHLGRMWSAVVTLKEGHRLIRSGPYRLVRHPIYTGILTGLTAVALVRANPAALLALPFFAAGFARKIVLEERMLAAHFGEEYANYRRETRALLPFVW